MKVAEVFTLGYGGHDDDHRDKHWHHDRWDWGHRRYYRRWYWDRWNRCWRWG